MAAGDFSQQPSKQPEPGSLLAHAYQMQIKLRDMIVEVKNQAGHVGDMAHSLATSAGQIAENVNHESDSVSSMAAAIEELSVSTTHISDQGANAKRIANDSRGNAEEGAKVVNKTVEGLIATAREIEAASAEVSRLGEDASRISEVVKVIKEIRPTCWR
jgi:methyl-accepting chemotaxis protein